MKKKVIISQNAHYRDGWSLSHSVTYLVIEDPLENDGDGDAGKVLAEFRHRDHAILFCGHMGWETVLEA